MMRKARTGKEKTPDSDSEMAAEGAEEERPRARRKVSEEADKAAKRRSRKEGAPEEGQIRRILTAISRPARAEGFQNGREQAEVPAAPPPAPPPPEVAKISAEPPRSGEPMQVIKLNDLKRMKITELSKMAHDLTIESAQGLKKQDLIFTILSGITDKHFEVNAEAVLELLSDGFC